jgi:hypothetical protein
MGHKWIRGVHVALFVAVLVMLASCGKDGTPGTSSLGVWVNYDEADDIYAMSCSALPGYYHYGLVSGGYAITGNTYYPEPEGSWGFAYQLHWYSYYTGNHYSNIYTGTISIKVDPGTKGGFPFKDGVNGAVRKYNWLLGWSGSTIAYDRTGNADLAAPAQNELQLSAIEMRNRSIEGTPFPLDPAKYDIGPTRTVTTSDGEYIITISEYPLTLKGTTPELPKNQALPSVK